MSIPDPPGMRLGRRPADPARLARTVRLRFTGALPPHPVTADHFSSVSRWMLGGNDLFGTCGPVSVANFAVLTWKYLLGQDIMVTDDAVFDLYRRSGNPGFDPATGADDNGVDMTVMLAELVRNGITITRADGSTEVIKPLCFAAHGTAIDDVRAVTSIFGGDLFGFDLDVAQQSQRTWDYVPGSVPWGGHAVVGGSYNSLTRALEEPDESVVSWQQVYGTTDAFVARQLAEAYAVVFEPLWDHPAFQAGIDQAALAADFEAVTGRPFPVPVTPPAPAPPADVHVDAADRAYVASVPAAWEDRRHVGDNGRAAAAYKTWKQAKGLA